MCSFKFIFTTLSTGSTLTPLTWISLITLASPPVETIPSTVCSRLLILPLAVFKPDCKLPIFVVWVPTVVSKLLIASALAFPFAPS